MSRLIIITLTDDKGAAIEKGFRHGPSHAFRTRCRMILLDAAQPVMPKANRSNVYRLLVRHQVNRLPKQQQSGQEDKHGQFKDYGPGFVHMDCFIWTDSTCQSSRARSVTAS